MIIRNVTMAAMIAASLSAAAAAPEGYYDSLEGLKRTELRAQAGKIALDHKIIEYRTETWDAFKKTDAGFINGRQAWLDMYSSNVVYTSQGHTGLNIEHSVPNSWWGGKDDSKGGNYKAYCDIVALNPSDEEANNKKSNHPLGEVRSVSWTNGVSTVGQPVSGQGGGASYVFEPADEYKGDFARTYFYMFTTYADIKWLDKYDWMYDNNSVLFIKPWAVEMLLRWAAEDPVDEKEIRRNDQIYKVQGNRNPFIDLPHLAEYIWGSKNKLPFVLDEGTTGADLVYGEQSDEPEAYFDLQGRRVAEPAAGLYIVRYKSGKSEKMIVK